MWFPSRDPSAQIPNEKMGALEVTLTAEQLTRVDEVSPKGIASGSRYPEAMMKLTNR